MRFVTGSAGRMQATIFIPSRAGLVAVDIEQGGLISRFNIDWSVLFHRMCRLTCLCVNVRYLEGRFDYFLLILV